MAFTDSDKLRILADWFDAYDDLDQSGRVGFLIDSRSPGKHGVSADLRDIAEQLPPMSFPQDAAGKLRVIAMWFEARPAVIGQMLESPWPNEEPADREVQRDLRAIAARLEAN